MRAAAAVVAAVGVLAGCGDAVTSPEDAGPSVRATVDEVAAHDGKVCPRRLPQPADPARDDKLDGPARSAPTLPAPESAWVCRYDPHDGLADREGAREPGWVRHGRAHPVDAARLLAIQRELDGLVPAGPERLCTADLGPRWLLVFTHGTDLTGVVVDDFGCRDVRLTDEPFRTVPGDSTQPGVVPGVLTGGSELLDALGRGRR